MLRIVDDQQSGLAIVGEVFFDGGFELGHQLPSEEFGIQIQLTGNAVEHAAQPQGRIVDVDQRMMVFIQGVGKGAQGGGFARADFAGDERNPPAGR